jgi:hypothetical protein
MARRKQRKDAVQENPCGEIANTDVKPKLLVEEQVEKIDNVIGELARDKATNIKFKQTHYNPYDLYEQMYATNYYKGQWRNNTTTTPKINKTPEPVDTKEQHMKQEEEIKDLKKEISLLKELVSDIVDGLHIHGTNLQLTIKGSTTTGKDVDMRYAPLVGSIIAERVEEQNKILKMDEVTEQKKLTWE